jgi:hypothetical protein
VQLNKRSNQINIMAGSTDEEAVKFTDQAWLNEFENRTDIPVALNDPGLTMCFRDVHTGNLPTIFVGCMDEPYPEARWIEDVDRIIKLFDITDLTRIGYIKITPERNGAKIDEAKLLRAVTEAIAVINKTTDKKIRIVGLGVRGAKRVYEALEHLVRGWKVPVDQKEIQFVAVGEYDNYASLKFCKVLCLKKLCAAVEVYNTKDYNDFGYLNWAVSALYNLDLDILPDFLRTRLLAADLSKHNKATPNLLADLSKRTKEPPEA